MATVHFPRIYFIIPLLISIFASCSPTKPSGKTISGTIKLDGATDFSNIKVSLYQLPQIDTSLSNAISKYPAISPEIDLSLLLFDHRRQKSLAQSLTDKNGNFSFSDIPEGEYILFVEKDGYGWDYFKISTSGEIPIINLKKENIVSGVLGGNNIWSQGNYVINGDLEIPSGSELIITNGSIVRFINSSRINVKGKIQIGERPSHKPVVFTSEDTAISWGGIKISEGGSADVNSLTIRDADVGIFVDRANLSISSTAFVNNKNYGISSLQIGLDKKVEILNCIFAFQPIGINFEFVDTSVYIKNSTFISNSEAGIYCSSSGARIEGNYFAKNKYAIRAISNAGGYLLKILNNEFSSSQDYHICLQGQDGEIKYNNITSTNGGILLGNMYLKKTWAIVNYNNLIGKRYLLRLMSHTSNIDARYNYWGTISEAEIKNLIFDRNDVLPSDYWYQSYGVVDYSNYLSEPLKSAGIKKKF